MKTLLIAHNISGLFGEQFEDFLKFWVESLSTLVNEKKADFVALHMQEVGGSMWKTEGAAAATPLVQAIIAAFPEFWCSGMLINTDTSNSTTWSALGSVYLVRVRRR